MDRNFKTKKGMRIKSKTRVKVAGLINDLRLLKSLPGICNDVAKNYKLGCQFMKYLKEIKYINSDKATVNYHNPKNHSADYVLDYVMSRYEAEYSEQKKESDLVTCEVELPSSMKDAAQEVIYKNQIRNLQSDLNRHEACIHTLQNELQRKYELINELTKKKSIFAKIKTLFQ